MESPYERIVSGVKSYFKREGITKAVIGLSGGIDSSLSAKVVADAIGKDNLHGIIMPVRGVSSEENVKDSLDYAKNYLGIGFSVIYINDFIKCFENVSWIQTKQAKMNTASRIRAVILYNYANANNALVIGTSNKTEIQIGYFTKYGDGAVDIEVIGSLYKTEVIRLARQVGIPNKIVDKVPTAELFNGQTDEAEIGASYTVVDEVLKCNEKGRDLSGIRLKHGAETVDRIIGMQKRAYHKLCMPPII